MTDTLNADDRQDYLDQPVNDLHKIHGHFTDEAKSAPPALPPACRESAARLPRRHGCDRGASSALAETIISAVRYDRSRTSGSHSR